MQLAQKPYFPLMTGLVVQAVKDVISDGAVAGGVDHDRQLLRRKRLDGRQKPLELIAECFDDRGEGRESGVAGGPAFGAEQLDPSGGILRRLGSGGGDR